MSSRKEKLMSLAGIDFTNKTDVGIRNLFKRVLNNGMHGLCFSAYVEGQNPGDQLNEDQIRRRMKVIQPYTKWIRSFSCIDGNEHIPRIAHEYGIKTMVGAWLGDDPEVNKKEVQGLIELANEGCVDIAAVGNEVLLRGDLSEDELLGFINQVKEAIPDIPVGYVDAYYEFTQHPRIVDASDVILANCYPFWEGCSLEYSLVYMKQMYHQAIDAARGKKVIISETGWPNIGTSFQGANPSFINAMKYFINTQVWSDTEDVEIFYFSSFDESWKVGAEGDVGAYWGIWDKDEKLKY
jgi:exo-beta-1,3-glucanase (GH17 family)